MSSPQHHILGGIGVPMDAQMPTADWGEPRLLQRLGAGWDQVRLSAGLCAEAVLVGGSQDHSHSRRARLEEASPLTR